MTRNDPSEEPPAKAPPLRRRGERMRRAVLDATVELLTAHGYEGATVPAIAAAAGVHESSLYRHWGTREDLVLDAAVRHSEEHLPEPPRTGDIAADLTRMMRDLVRYLSTPQGAALVRLTARPAPAPLGEERTRYWHRRLGLAADRVREALDSGELRPDADPALVIDALAGPLFARLTLFGEVMTEDRATALVQQTLHGVLP